jgi:putative oxidoreductase
MRHLWDWLFAHRAMDRQPHGPAAGLLFLRLAGGAFMLTHGWGKLVGFAERAATFSDPLGVGSVASLSLAVFAEFFCACLVMLGLATRLAAIPLLITMLVAAFLVHGGDPWPKQELPLLYATCWLALFFAGPGRYSLDYLMARRRG